MNNRHDILYKNIMSQIAKQPQHIPLHIKLKKALISYFDLLQALFPVRAKVAIICVIALGLYLNQINEVYTEQLYDQEDLYASVYFNDNYYQ
tara:strand:+ start:1963 stop:2238 length:276 start_codon:yes stop_codon:yes gene_type:complete